MIEARDDQLDAARRLVQRVLETDTLAARTLRAAGVQRAEDVQTADDLTRLPRLTRAELLDDQVQHPPFGTLATLPPRAYRRAVRTLGSEGPPLAWLDTADSLRWRADCWATILDAAGVTADDVVLLGLPPGATAADAAAGLASIGALVLASQDVAHEYVALAPSVVVCTPAQALALSRPEVARPAATARLVVLSGAPGGSLPSVRRRLEERLGARCLDVYALTELGPAGSGCPRQPGRLHLDEDAFIWQIEDGELIATAVAQPAMPLIRYATGDLVDASSAQRGACVCGRQGLSVEGGVLGRRSQQLRLREATLLPSSIENVARRHPAVVDVRLRVYGAPEACQVSLELEPEPLIASEGDQARMAAEVCEDVRRSLGVRVQCEVLPPGSLAPASYVDGRPPSAAVGRRPRRFSRQ